MSLEAKIKQMLEAKKAAAAATLVSESATNTETPAAPAEAPVAEEAAPIEEPVVEPVAEEKPAEAAEPVAEEKPAVSEQISGLFAAEGLSEEFKTQAVAIFEAAVNDRVLQIEESLKAEYDQKIEDAKEAMFEYVDGYLTKAVEVWINENQVALESNYKASLNESLVDGMFALLAEHNVAIPEETDVLEDAVQTIESMEAALSESKQACEELQNKLNEIEKSRILESFTSKMANTQADRFVKLVESIGFESTEQYTKQLEVVKENFITAKESSEQPTAKPVSESAKTSVVEEYASFLKRTSH